jgi:hypothetical protein
MVSHVESLRGFHDGDILVNWYNHIATRTTPRKTVAPLDDRRRDDPR